MWSMSYFYFKRWQNMFISTSSHLLNFSGVVYIKYRRRQQLSNPWKHPCDESDWAVSKTQAIWYQVLTPCSSRGVKKTKWISILLSSECCIWALHLCSTWNITVRILTFHFSSSVLALFFLTCISFILHVTATKIVLHLIANGYIFKSPDQLYIYMPDILHI